MLVDRCNISHGAAVSEIGVVVLKPSEVMAGVSKVRVWKSVPSATVPSEVEVMRSNGICTLRGCTSIGTLGVWMGNRGDGGAATARPRRVAI